MVKQHICLIIVWKYEKTLHIILVNLNKKAIHLLINLVFDAVLEYLYNDSAFSLLNYSRCFSVCRKFACLSIRTCYLWRLCLGILGWGNDKKDSRFLHSWKHENWCSIKVLQVTRYLFNSNFQSLPCSVLFELKFFYLLRQI